nr:unnamed protein product [Callosobruchus chinensis]CAH7751815.1 unnamed protein product [Callosobruchus chinensis]
MAPKYVIKLHNNFIFVEDEGKFISKVENAVDSDHVTISISDADLTSLEEKCMYL